jgi:hypothetical protein
MKPQETSGAVNASIEALRTSHVEYATDGTRGGVDVTHDQLSFVSGGSAQRQNDWHRDALLDDALSAGYDPHHNTMSVKDRWSPAKNGVQKDSGTFIVGPATTAPPGTAAIERSFTCNYNVGSDTISNLQTKFIKNV